jgi:flagellar M-ring protein FliF
MSATEEAREQYRPDSQILRSEQLSEESSASGNAASGVPGALTNQPPEKGVAQPPGAQPARGGVAAVADATGQGGSNSKQSTRNYEVDRTVAYTRQPAGRLRRLSVAVLIDNVRVVGADGKITESALPPAQIERITSLVRDAVGFDAARGDSVNVVNSPWKGEPVAAAETLESIPIWERPWLQDLARIIAGLVLALVVVFAVLRPMLRQLLGPAGKLAVAGGGGQVELAPGAGGGAVAVPGAGMGGAAAAASGTNLAYEQQIATARSLVAQDPARVAQVVKSWVATDG